MLQIPPMSCLTRLRPIYLIVRTHNTASAQRAILAFVVDVLLSGMPNDGRSPLRLLFQQQDFFSILHLQSRSRAIVEFLRGEEFGEASDARKELS